MTRARILVIEDEDDIREVISYALSREGYDVESAVDGEAGLEKVTAKAPDLVILDLMLPGLDGVEVCRHIKTDPVTQQIPVIMVTAKGEESDVVLGLGVGADDYVPKPFSPRELVARVKAVLRRGPTRDERESRKITRDGVVIDAERHEVLIDAAPVPFTATEFRLIHLLLSHPGRVFTRGELLRRVIADNAYVLDRNIDVHVRTIRKKLGPYRDLVETVRGVGYRSKTTE